MVFRVCSSSDCDNKCSYCSKCILKVVCSKEFIDSVLSSMAILEDEFIHFKDEDE